MKNQAQTLRELSDAHKTPAVNFSDLLPSLPHDLHYRLEWRLLAVDPHEVKQVALEVLVDEVPFLFVSVHVQSQVTITREPSVELLAFPIYVVGHTLHNERLVFASLFGLRVNPEVVDQ